jgi:hypothetical protein
MIENKARRSRFCRVRKTEPEHEIEPFIHQELLHERCKAEGAGVAIEVAFDQVKSFHFVALCGTFTFFCHFGPEFDTLSFRDSIRETKVRINLRLLFPGYAIGAKWNI